MKQATFEPRFWAKVDKSNAWQDGCWAWTAALDADGYGLFKLHGRMQRAHRVSWELAHGSTGGLGVLHHCDNPRCVSPAHLFLGTHSDNLQDAADKGRINTQNGIGAVGQPGVRGSLPLHSRNIAQRTSQRGRKMRHNRPKTARQIYASRYGNKGILAEGMRFELTVGLDALQRFSKPFT